MVSAIKYTFYIKRGCLDQIYDDSTAGLGGFVALVGWL